MFLLILLNTATPSDVSFSVVVSVVSGILTLGTAFSYFFSLRERVSKLEVKAQAQEEQINFLKSITNSIGEKLNAIQNAVTEIKAYFQYHQDNK